MCIHIQYIQYDIYIYIYTYPVHSPLPAPGRLPMVSGISAIMLYVICYVRAIV